MFARIAAAARFRKALLAAAMLVRPAPLPLLGLLPRRVAEEARAQGEHREGRGGVDRRDGGDREPRPGAVSAWART